MSFAQLNIQRHLTVNAIISENALLGSESDNRSALRRFLKNSRNDICTIMLDKRSYSIKIHMYKQLFCCEFNGKLSVFFLQSGRKFLLFISSGSE